MAVHPLPVVRGRGASWNPPNRFETLSFEREAWHDPDDPAPETVFLRDRSRSILVRNDSPDVGLDVGINPYRGCAHGCSYCYARPTHEYLGFSAGLDFETRILVKEDAPRLLERRLSSSRWKAEPIMLSGNTDPYQPAERRLRVTRRCLEVLERFGNPVAITTKSYLVTRDVDLLSSLARRQAAAVTLSVTTLKNDLHSVMEPRASVPGRRLGAIRVLADAGIPVGVNVAPVIPGLTDHELPAILEAAADAGASFANYIMLRLPHGMKDLFLTWLEQHFPERKDKVVSRLRSLRDGGLYDARFGTRGRGEGPFAAQIQSMFRVTRDRLGLNRPPELSAESFLVPAGDPGPQIELFS